MTTTVPDKAPMPTKEDVRAELEAEPARLEALIGALPDHETTIVLASVSPEVGTDPGVLRAFADLAHAIKDIYWDPWAGPAPGTQAAGIRNDTGTWELVRPATHEELVQAAVNGEWYRRWTVWNREQRAGGAR